MAKRNNQKKGWRVAAGKKAAASRKKNEAGVTARATHAVAGAAKALAESMAKRVKR